MTARPVSPALRRRLERTLEALATVPDRQLADEDLRAAGAIAINRGRRPHRR